MVKIMTLKKLLTVMITPKTKLWGRSKQATAKLEC